jgi:hypothetical protein
MILGGAVVAALVVGGSVAPAKADSTVNCPLVQATRTIVNLPSGWVADMEQGNLTDHRVDGPSGQQVLVCEYGDAGEVNARRRTARRASASPAADSAARPS